MTNLTFFGGVNEIGGNKILLEDKDTRLFFDFGESFGFGSDFFVEWLAPRNRFGLRDYFALNLMPKIKGLYSREALLRTDFKYVHPEFQGVFISHIHYDHSTHIQFIDEEIPVYLGATALRMLESWETTSTQVDFGDHDYRTFKTGSKIKIDDLLVEPVHVDHSTPSAYGFIIYASDATIAYTGDFRLHGPHARMTHDFIERAAEARPDVLICEGTRVAPVDKRENLSEQKVYERCHGLISNCDKLALTCFYGRDIDRMKTYHALAKECDRKFVVSNRVAHLLKSLVDDPGIEVPNPIDDEHMLVYCREMKSTKDWEEEFEDCGVDSEFVRQNQNELILHLDFYHFTELIDIEPEIGSLFIHSMSEPIEEDDEQARVRKNWIDHFSFKYHQAHASGHLNRVELAEVIRTINPQKIIPIHTEHPEMFKEYTAPRLREVVIPEVGSKYEV